MIVTLLQIKTEWKYGRLIIFEDAIFCGQFSSLDDVAIQDEAAGVKQLISDLSWDLSLANQSEDVTEVKLEKQKKISGNEKILIDQLFNLDYLDARCW